MVVVGIKPVYVRGVRCTLKMYGMVWYGIVYHTREVDTMIHSVYIPTYLGSSLFERKRWTVDRLLLIMVWKFKSYKGLGLRLINHKMRNAKRDDLPD